MAAEQQQEASNRGSLRENLKRKIIIERVSANYCKQCKLLAFPARCSSQKTGSPSSDDEGEEEAEENEEEFCSSFCKQHSKNESECERDRKWLEAESNVSETGSGSVTRLLSSPLEERDVDGGYAWVILAAMFMINASTYGTARAYGLIFDRIAREGEQSRTMASLPFNLMGALENLAGPLAGYLLALSSWRVTIFLGSCLITMAHLLASFSDSTINQLLSMGLMCGLGLSLVSISSFNINNAYFNKYRSRAFGFCLTGAAVGTFYISPLCEYVLDEYSVAHCYLLLAFILSPNIILSLLLKPKKKPDEPRVDSSEIITSTETHSTSDVNETTLKLEQEGSKEQPTNLGNIISKRKEEEEEAARRRRGKKAKEGSLSLLKSVKLVISTPMFHLIWTTQLLFCWLNFVFGMIIVDFGKDRGLDNDRATDLVLIWAFGQLFGRLGLGYLVDIKLVSYRTFTIICFLFISLINWCMDNVRIENYQDYVIFGTVFLLSMFIAVLYILFNGLTTEYMDKSVSAFTVGISSFIGSFLLFPRANLIGYYRDTMGNYDGMLTLFQYVSLGGALIWLLLPWLFGRIRTCYVDSLERQLSRTNETKCAEPPEVVIVVASTSAKQSHVSLPSVTTAKASNESIKVIQ